MIQCLVVRSSLVLGLVGLAACSGLLEPSGEEQVAESQLTFVHVAPDAPPLAETEVSFWIKRGEDREVQIRYVYHRADGSMEYGKCLRLFVPAEAPLRHPDGRRFAAGDSARVTIRVADPAVFRFEFDPSGLRFDPDHPAQLEIRYSYASDDINGDGAVNQEDERIWKSFRFWHQRLPGEEWTAIRTTRLENVLEARASITGFSQYALASN